MKVSAPQSLKFIKLKRRLKLSHWQCVGLLESLWLFTQHNAPAGDIGRHDDEDIAAAIEWDGDPAGLVADLVDCGWLDRCDEHRLVVHDWEDHAPTYIKGVMSKSGLDFARTTKTPTKTPTKFGTKTPTKLGTKSPLEGELSGTAPRVAEQLPSLAIPSLANPSSESREPDKPASRPADSVLAFPTVGTGPTEWHLTRSQVSDWSELFPGVDVLAECRKALAWVLANPAKRKTHRGMPSFLVRWLQRVTDGGRGGRQPPATSQAVVTPPPIPNQENYGPNPRTEALYQARLKAKQAQQHQDGTTHEAGNG